MTSKSIEKLAYAYLKEVKPYYPKKFANFPIKRIIRHCISNEIDYKKIPNLLDLMHFLSRKFENISSIDNEFITYCCAVFELFRFMVIFYDSEGKKDYFFAKDMNEMYKFVLRNKAIECYDFNTFEILMPFSLLPAKIMKRLAKKVVEPCYFKSFVNIKKDFERNTCTLNYLTARNTVACVEVGRNGIRHYEKDRHNNCPIYNLFEAINIVNKWANLW